MIGKINRYRIALALLLIGLWETISDRLISFFWISSPSAIIRYLAEITLDGSLFENLSVTFLEMILGYVLGGVAGILVGFVLGRFESLGKVLDPFLYAFNGVPRIALAPLVIVWFGIGLPSKVVIAALVVFFITFVNTFSGIKEASQELKNIVKVMGGTELDILRKVVLPTAWPWILAALKLSLPYALTGAVVGEFVAASKGLGFMIQYSSSMFDVTGSMAGIIILAIVVIILNSILDRVEGMILRWRPKSPETGGSSAEVM